MSFDDIIDTGDTAKEKAKTAVEGRLTTALFFLCLTASIALSFVETGVVNPFSPELWLGLANRFLTTYVTFILFIPQGERDEFLRDKRHSTVLDTLEELSASIYNGGLLTAFYAFCEVKEGENTDKARRHIYSRFISPEVFGGIATSKVARQQYKAGTLTKEQYRAVKKALAVKSKRIKPAYILTACSVDKTEEAGTDMMSYARKSILRKPVVFILMSIVLNSVTLTWTSASLVETITGIVTSGMLIFYSALSGYKVGKNSAEWETSQRQHRIRFIKEFYERRAEDQASK